MIKSKDIIYSMIITINNIVLYIDNLLVDFRCFQHKGND